MRMIKEQKEKLIQHLKYSLEIGADYMISDGEAIEIIRSLEQESILDKIISEIEQTAKDYDKFDDYRRQRSLWIALDIINKYKKESEE